MAYNSRTVAIALILFSVSVLSLGQEQGGPKRRPPLEIDLLAMDGSSTIQAANGEGVVALRSSLIFQLGPTRVKALDPAFKLYLPAGYSLFNGLSYLVESEAVVTGPHLISLKLPSASNKAVFDNLHILHGELNEAEPDKPRWSDVTVRAEGADFLERYFTKAEFQKLLPDPGTYTLSGVAEQLGLFVVVTRDPAVVRDQFVADVGVSATAKPEAVLEGRELEYTYKIRNAGPDGATDVSFHCYFGLIPVSSNASQGICRYDAGNLYCNLGELAKGASATVVLTTKVPWSRFEPDPSMDQPLRTEFEVRAAEGDPHVEDNMRLLQTRIIRDSNQAPQVRILSPSERQFFVGPVASIKIVAQAHDQDGKVSKVEFFDRESPIGEGKLTENNQYEFNYRNLTYGWHWLTATVTDDQGRESGTLDHTNFLVNGQARVAVVSPGANELIPRSAGSVTVRVRAIDRGTGIKRVAISLSDEIRAGGGGSQDGTPVGNDLFETRFDFLGCLPRCRVEATVTNNSGVQTLSAPLVFKLTDPPSVSLYRNDGEYAREIKNGITLEHPQGMELTAKSLSPFDFDKVIAKVEFYANQKLICTDVNSKETHPYYPHGDFHCTLPNLAPGKYTLVAIATDSDGVEGKSTAVDIVIK